jgi:hypothetical protein
VPVKTGPAGIYVDREGLILRPFDDLSCNAAQFALSHKKFGELLLPITREELLAALQVNRLQPKRTATDGVIVEVECPAAIRSGTQFEIGLTVTNRGPRPAGRVLGRTISRHTWLNGRVFYIGTLSAGQKQSFRRRFRVPERLAGDNVYGTLGVWNILGPMPGKNVLLSIPVEHGTVAE